MTCVTTQRMIAEKVKLLVSEKDLPAMLTFVQQWYTSVFPLVPGFKQAVFSTEPGTLIIEAQWSDAAAMEAQGSDARLAGYFLGLQQWFTGWPDITRQNCE